MSEFTEEEQREQVQISRDARLVGLRQNITNDIERMNLAQIEYITYVIGQVMDAKSRFVTLNLIAFDKEQGDIFGKNLFKDKK